MKKTILVLSFVLTIVCAEAQVGFINYWGVTGSSGVIWLGSSGSTTVSVSTPLGGVYVNTPAKKECYWETQTVTETVPTGWLKNPDGSYVLINGQYVVTQSTQRTTKKKVKVCD